MRQLPTLLTFALFTVQIQISSSTGTIPKQSSACDREKTDLICRGGEKIAIRGVEYSVRRTRTRPCSYKPGDCRFRVNSDVAPLSVLCAGRTRCHINDTRLNSRAKSGNCTGTPLYRTIHYDCIPDTTIGRICSANEKVGRTLYLVNSEYPGRIKDGISDCLCSVSTDGGNKVTIRANELTLTPSVDGQACEESINISDSTKTEVFDCSRSDVYRGYVEIFSGGPSIEVRLKWNSSKTGGRFLWELNENGSKNLTLRCYQEGESPTEVQSHPSAPPTSDGNKDGGIDVVAIGVGAAAAVVLIALVVFIICLFRKRKRGLERKSSERTMDIRDGVVDPFLVTADPRAVDDSRNGTGSFRPTADRPSPQELVYATPGYSAPWESYSLPSPSPPPSAPPPPSDPPPLPSVPPQGYRNGHRSHYTYITPDILDHVTPNGENQQRPKPAVRKSKTEESLSGNGHNSGKTQNSETFRNRDSKTSASDAETVFVENSLYQSADT